MLVPASWGTPLAHPGFPDYRTSVKGWAGAGVGGRLFPRIKREGLAVEAQEETAPLKELEMMTGNIVLMRALQGENERYITPNVIGHRMMDAVVD